MYPSFLVNGFGRLQVAVVKFEFTVTSMWPGQNENTRVEKLYHQRVL